MRAQSREQKLLLFFWKRKNAQICRWFPFIGINDFRSKQNSWLLTKTETEWEPKSEKLRDALLQCKMACAADGMPEGAEETQ